MRRLALYGDANFVESAVGALLPTIGSTLAALTIQLRSWSFLPVHSSSYMDTCRAAFSSCPGLRDLRLSLSHLEAKDIPTLPGLRYLQIATGSPRPFIDRMANGDYPGLEELVFLYDAHKLAEDVDLTAENKFVQEARRAFSLPATVRLLERWKSEFYQAFVSERLQALLRADS